MLALLMLPLAVVLYSVTIVTLMSAVYSFRNEVAPFAWTSVVVWAFVAVYWTLLWRRTVRWTARRIGFTVAAAAAAVLPGVTGGALVSFDSESFGAFIGGVITVLFWLFCTVLIWQETRPERVARLRARGDQTVVCPSCGYNLTGLRQTACPECGASYTVDELVALQPHREASDL
jgi:hypothetical protein